jgi:F-type H+-transporting ATPase subunit c
MENANDLALMGRFIGAGLACFALLGAAIGVGNIFAAYLEGAMRNPSAAASQTGNLFVGAGLAEAAGLFGFVIAIMLLLGIGAS